MIGGIIAGITFDNVLGAAWSTSKQLHVINVPGTIAAGKTTNITFITFSNGAAIGNTNITLAGAASGRGMTDENGMLELAVNAVSNGSINVTAERSGYENATSIIKSTPGLDISVSPASITSGVASYVTFSVTGLGKPVGGAAVNLSGAGIALDGLTNSNGQIVIQVNAPNTGTITATARKVDFAQGSVSINSTAQQTLGVSSSHTTLIVNVPVYVTFTVTAGGSGVNDARVSLSGAATGSGITNQDGRAVILVTPQTTGTITASASATGYAGGSTAITSASTQSLSLGISPTTITAGIPSYVIFTVTSGSTAVSEATVTLTGAASGNGITNQNGQVILQVNSTGTGTITASVSKPGYSSTSSTFTSSGQPTLSISANPSSIANGVATYVTFTVKSGSSAISGATVSVSGGGITADGMTNSAGEVTLLLNAAGTGTINVAAKKSGYVDGLITLGH